MEKRKIFKPAMLKPTNIEKEKVSKKKRDTNKITEISEKLNDEKWDFNIFLDTTVMIPGLVVYVVGKVSANKRIPWDTYRPEPRIITAIHDNGVNKGTLFMTYEHHIEKESKYDADKNYFGRVVSEEKIIYSPLTKDHAEYICKLLNIQSKQMYMNNKKRMLHQQKTN